MKCPHCLEGFKEVWDGHNIGHDSTGISWQCLWTTCPTCNRFIIFLEHYPNQSESILSTMLTSHEVNRIRIMVYPKGISRSSLPTIIPDKYANDYKKACLVLPDSEEASAALSRRCLQALLRDEAKVKHSDLSNEIQQVIDSGKLPSHLSENIDAIRNVGNFAAHPIKSEKTGEVVDVEPGEAGWLLDVLEGLFDFYIVQPAKSKAKRDALDKKLGDAGKPPMKR